MKIPEELQAFPPNTAEDIRRANDLFQHYLFFDKEGCIRATCCGETQTLGRDRIGVHRDKEACPFCGRSAMWYAAWRGKKGLKEYQPCLFLHKRERKVYGDAVWLKKDYEHSLTPKIEFHSTYAYIFEDGAPRMWENGKYSGSWCEFETNDWFAHRIAPFRNEIGTPSFSVIGLERLRDTCLEYVPHERAKNTQEETGRGYHDLTKLLMLYCLYPQIEMLHKAGLDFLIRGLMWGVKNSEIMDWTQTDPRKALHMDGAELKALMQHRYQDPDILRFRARMRRSGFAVTVDEAADIVLNCGANRRWQTLSKVARESQIDPRKIFRYIAKHVSQCSHGGGFFRITDVFEYYRDYIGFAESLGYSMRDRMIVMPPNLKDAHDRAASAVSAIAAEKAALAEVEERERMKKQVKKLDRKYAFAHAGYLIRAAVSASEVVAEGKILRHCVGGYAERYSQGVVTILVLRDETKPHKPLATIEMNGNILVQVHGYRNEWDPCPENPNRTPARELYVEILDPWLAWIKAGSKRDKKTGEPVLTQKRKERKTA